MTARTAAKPAALVHPCPEDLQENAKAESY
jgi:hypothetical protein